MDNLGQKLKLKAVTGKNPFDYSIKKYSELEEMNLAKTNEVKRESNVLKYDYQDLTNATKTFPVNRRDERMNSVELRVPSIEPHKKSSFRSHVNLFEIPLDFSRTITNSSKSKLIPKDEDSNGISSGKNESLACRLESKEFRENGRVFTFNKKSSEMMSKTSSFDLSSEISIMNLKAERKSLKPFIREVPELEIQLEDIEKKQISGLNTGDREEILHNIREANKKLAEINHLNFDEALIAFNNSQLIYSDKELWITSFSQKLLCCKKKANLTPEFQELCEKMIIFSYMNFDTSNSFHSSLLASVLRSLQGLSEGSSWEKTGFSCDPYKNELKHNVANFGLFLVLFLVEYFHRFVESFLSHCFKQGLVFVSIVFDVSELAIVLLRKRKFVMIMNECQKCLEILFFFSAGCLCQWLTFHRTRMEIGLILKEIEKIALNNPKSFINLGRDLMNYA